MNNLFAELLKEATRVQALETEVKRATEDLNNQIGLAREEKLAEIVSFLNEMNSIVLNTVPGEMIVVCTSGYHKNGNHKWGNSLRFGDHGVWLGIYLTNTMRFNDYVYIRNEMIDRNLLNTCFYHTVMSFIDGWNDETKRFTEEYIAKEIRRILAERIEKATADLKVVNNKHKEYYGKGE